MASITGSEDRNRVGPADVRGFLTKTLPNAELAELRGSPRLDPILLLRTKHTLVAFGFSNGNARKSYDSLYETFREAYLDEQKTWSALDLAFVFCVPPGLSRAHTLLSELEVDVYFCRKFVVRLEGSVDKALSLLPFVPLSPLAGATLRPPSAQSFLQREGLPASLARYLVVKGQRSAQTILDRCMAGEFGPGSLSRSSGRPPLVAVRQSKSHGIRLKSIAISNFRAYKKAEFVFGDAVTVLYGPNGFGKTSVFDAIDFAATGEVGRLGIADERRFRRAMVHLGADGEQSGVRLLCETSTGHVRVERTVSDRRTPWLDGVPTDRKSALTALTGGRGVVAERVENLISIFRATHLFSHEHQAVAPDFQRTCELSAGLVARLLAFEDYGSARTKADDVCTLIGGAIGELSDQITTLTAEKTREEEEAASLEQVLRAAFRSDQLEAQLETVRGRVADAGIVVGSYSPGLEVLRGWRGVLESRITEMKARRGHAQEGTSLAKDLVGLQRRKREVQSRIDGLTSRLTRVQKDIVDLRAAIRVDTSKADAAEAPVVQLRDTLGRLKWAITVAPTHEQLRKEYVKQVGLVEQGTQDLEALRESASRAEAALAEATGALEQTRESRRLVGEQLGLLEGVRDSVDRWRERLSRLASVVETENGLNGRLDDLSFSEGEARRLLGEAEAAESTALRRLEEEESKQVEHRNLLARLKELVSDGRCPLCGEDHGNIDLLLGRIDEQTAMDTARESRAAFEVARTLRRSGAEDVQNISFSSGRCREALRSSGANGSTSRRN